MNPENLMITGGVAIATYLLVKNYEDGQRLAASQQQLIDTGLPIDYTQQQQYPPKPPPVDVHSGFDTSVQPPPPPPPITQPPGACQAFIDRITKSMPRPVNAMSSEESVQSQCTGETRDCVVTPQNRQAVINSIIQTSSSCGFFGCGASANQNTIQDAINNLPQVGDKWCTHTSSGTAGHPIDMSHIHFGW